MRITYVLLKIKPNAQIDKELFNMIESVDDGGHKIVEHTFIDVKEIEKNGEPNITFGYDKRKKKKLSN